MNKLFEDSGFTYIEVLITVIILMTAFGGIAQVLATCIQASSRADHLKTAIDLARSDLDRIVATGITDNDSNEITDEPGYNREAEISGPDAEGLYRAEVIVTWQEAGQERQESLAAYYCRPEPVGSGSAPKEQADAGLAE